MRCRLLALILAVTACGGASADMAVPASSSSARTESAPAFTLELGAGGTFTLMDENRPVYLLFWAEW
jgi:hypothetical protein